MVVCTGFEPVTFSESTRRATTALTDYDKRNGVFAGGVNAPSATRKFSFEFGGRYRVRTCDFNLVRVALYR